MIKYSGNEIEKVFCNCCGKKMAVEHGVVKEGVFIAEIKWGYFSEKDGEQHNFDLCEMCYDTMVKNFKIPVEHKNFKEFL